jgi:signal transduction histidine kinase
MADLEEVRAAVSNLIDNAVKYSGKDVNVRVETEQIDGYVLMRVKDAGVGIPKTELKRVFKRFHRVPGPLASRVKGTGLGLFIVRSVAKRHGGRAWAESEGRAAEARFSCNCRWRNDQILVVEDEQHLAEGLRFNLERKGIRCAWWKPAKRRWSFCRRPKRRSTWWCSTSCCPAKTDSR